MSLRDLATLNSTELQSFLNSFDKVLCDCDGVIWSLNKEIPEVEESLEKLRKCGKEIHFVSNNCTHTQESFHKKLTKFRLGAAEHDTAFPTLAIIAYFKKIGFEKEVFVFGVPAMKQEFKNAGFKIAKDETEEVPAGLEDLPNILHDNEDVGAVVVDIDIGLDYIKLLKAGLYLKRSDVLFIMAGTDRKVPTGFVIPLIGAKPFESILESISGRTSTSFGKPSEQFEDFIKEKFNINNPPRTLFIGDSMEQDMTFATQCGYQKLLVLTGVTNLAQATKCTNPEMVPDYYISSLGDLHKLIKD